MDRDDAKMIKGGCVFAALGILRLTICFGGCYGLSKVEYSDGYRDGTIQKMSKKGVVWKTYEGEMILGGLDFQNDGSGGGTLNRQSFHFTVSDKKIIDEIEALPTGKKIRLHYRQGMTQWVPNGDTTYFVTSIEDILSK